jgi:hypothetical protein
VADPQDVATKLAREVERQLTIQAKLGEALLKELQDVALTGRPIRDFEGKVVDTVYVPDRDWSRCYQHYRGANKDLLAEQRERSKLQLMAQQQQSGGRVLTDDEYTAEMRQLSLESVKQLSDDELEAEIRQRGLKVVEVTERDE